VPPFKQWREFLVLSLILTLSIMTQFFCSADLPMILEDRVAAVGIATQFQEHSNQVLKMVEEETEYAKTQGMNGCNPKAIPLCQVRSFQV
jgi:magnesium chelatase subunit D